MQHLDSINYSLLHWDVFHLLGVPDSTISGLARRLKKSASLIASALEDWRKTGFVDQSPDGVWFCTAQRFGSSPVLLAQIAALYKMRIITRWQSGEAPPTPRFACIRLMKRDVERLRASLEDVMSEAWRLATSREADGNTCVFLSYDLDAIGETSGAQ